MNTRRQRPNGQPEVMVTTQRTSKKWKSLMLIAGLAMISSPCVCGISGLMDSQEEKSSWIAAGLAAFFLGLGLMIFARLAAWWHHS